MPEQKSARALPVTTSPIETPFQTPIVRFGVKGLNLRDSLDALEGWSRHTNLDHDNQGEARVRPGQTGFATAGSQHHSVRLLRDPNPTQGVGTRVWGIDTNLYVGMSAGLSQVDSGYSGDPLALVPHRPPLSGEPWMFVGDRFKMSKVDGVGIVIPIGLPAPTTMPTVALGPQYKTSIATCGSGDATAAANWTMVAGTDDNGTASNAPHMLDDGTPVGPPAVGFYLDPGTTIGNSTPFDSWAGIALTRDLTQVANASATPTSLPASDTDVFHFWMKTSHPQNIQEIRLYVVVSAPFDPTALPGTDNAAGANTDAYVKSFRQNDFVQFIQAAQTQIDAAETARIFALRDQDLQNRAITDARPGAATAIDKTDPLRDLSVQIGAGAHEWFELGSIGLALRRGDFKRIGSTIGRDWSTVTGLIFYVSSAQGALEVAFGQIWLEGGNGPDTMDPGQQPYDYVYTNYDPGTGAEGNPSPAMTDPIATGIDSLRRAIDITPTAYGNANIRQRIYRRGGSLVTDWFFCGTTTADGALFKDTLTDDGIAATTPVNNDHYQPVPTVDKDGNTVLAQPIRALWGPLEGMLYGCGDPYRPGHLYFCIPDEPDHWSANGNTEVCPPSEELMNGGLVGAQGFVFSRLRLYAIYPNLTGIAGSVTTNPTLCKRGLAGRWALAIGPGGIWFVATDGIYVSAGGPEVWKSKDIDPLFKGKTVNGYLPIDLTVETALRLTIWQNRLYFGYQDTSGARQVLVYSILTDVWLHYQFGRAQAGLQGEDEPTLLIGGYNTGTTYLHQGLTDAGAPINWFLRTGAISGGTREEKLFGDQFLDCDVGGGSISVQNFLDEETAPNTEQGITAAAGRQRVILDAFGEGPQKAHSLSTHVRGSSPSGLQVLYQMGVSVVVQPDITNERVTNWDDLGSPDEVWLTGITLDCDTGGLDKTVIIETDFGGVRNEIATFTVNCNGRHKVTFSWLAVSARMVRIAPQSTACQSWILYRADWIWQNEPPRIAAWDIHFENSWDQYYTGLDLYCDTFGQTKQVEVYVDGVRLANTLAGLTYWPITTTDRQVVHLTLPWGRGHVFRFRAIDTNPGLLYSHRWFLQEEPSEQANWNQNFSVYGTRADKWLKAVIFECDTFGQNKQVTIEADGTVVETLTVNATGRKVVQLALTVQHLGRVWRAFPVDGHPGRLYSMQPIFDQEPFALDRWETQETTHGITGWFTPLYGHLVLKSTAPVTLTIIQQVNQPRVNSQPKSVTTAYTLDSTGGVKASLFQTFQASKGVLVKYLLTSATPFWLYREETTVIVQPWGAPEPMTVHPFGSDDEDPSRPMVSATDAAMRSGGVL